MSTQPFNRQIVAKGLLTGVALVMGLGLLGESRSEKVEARVQVQQVKPMTLPAAPVIRQVGNATIQPATQTFQPRNTGRWVF